ncbi:hypothetical protein CWE08_04390 [Aliidiomarina iranensis]|uniref:NrS-1 polymerase-like HBD domain-containing protein n=1 Tax=Aliidiomarina iranensis TaxID=1434071 RepID=A0A432W084_9GAMM|nr:DUF3987 domain-containing protein [Aliidiomarina iranensis]RUO22425.1 hypothetical protein CWE08_04390 [Aliidiomarina iranensis]
MQTKKEAPAATEASDLNKPNSANYTQYQQEALAQGYKPRTVNEDVIELSVPGEIQDVEQWIVWQYQPNPGKQKPKKMPLRVVKAGFENGDVADAKTYMSFERALNLYRSNSELDGIGFALTESDPYTVADLDSCFSIDSGIDTWAQEKIAKAASWTELTPSEQGFHIVVKADVQGMKSKSKNYHDSKLELYRTGRFFTVTGNLLEQHVQHCEISDGQSFIECEHKAIVKAQNSSSNTPKAAHQNKPLSDAKAVLDVIAAVASKGGKGAPNAEQFLYLHNSGFSGEDHSADDLSYLNTAAFYTGKNAELMRELYLSSALYRPKSEREDYVQRSIDKAISGTQNVFEGASRYFRNEDEQPQHPSAWPEVVDPFSEYVTRQFPIKVLPKSIQDLCAQLSNQSGFDKGAYAFCFISAASALMDHTAKLGMRIMSQPPILWFALVSPSGGGKSPVMNAAMRFVRTHHDQQAKDSKAALERWAKACKAAKNTEETPPPKPPWRQTIIQDTTVEALATACADNPKGVIFYADELTGFIGQMDAYSSGGAASKDRGVYLSAFDGGAKTINRKNQQHPMVVDNLSLSILAGVQPEKLAEMYSQRGGGSSDGLFQRFMVYAMKEQQDVDYTAEIDPFTETSVSNLFQWLNEWKEAGFFHARGVHLSPQALPRLQQYHNDMKTIAQRTASARQAEHYNKYPGYVGRIAVVLHYLRCSAKGEYEQEVSLATLEDAIELMGALFSHSDAVYQVIERQAGGAGDLMRSAAEAILSKKWETFKRGDLTRNATGWREEKDRNKTENAIDLLIEFGWIADVTPAPVDGKRGRRSDGLFAVNPQVHDKFQHKAERIVQMRKERYEAIKRAGADRVA